MSIPSVRAKMIATTGKKKSLLKKRGDGHRSGPNSALMVVYRQYLCHPYLSTCQELPVLLGNNTARGGQNWGLLLKMSSDSKGISFPEPEQWGM